jgi:hypothetical protein
MNTSVHHSNINGVVARQFFSIVHPDEEGKTRQHFEQYGFSNVKFVERSRLIVGIKFDGPEILTRTQRQFLEAF